MEEAHSGVCGAHQSSPKLYHWIKRMGYYWPIMVKDCMDYAKHMKHASFMRTTSISRRSPCTLQLHPGLLMHGDLML